MMATDQVEDLLGDLDSDDLDKRLMAMHVLGEVGDAETLRILRARLVRVSHEHSALIVAVGTLKRRLGVK